MVDAALARGREIREALSRISPWSQGLLALYVLAHFAALPLAVFPAAHSAALLVCAAICVANPILFRTLGSPLWTISGATWILPTLLWATIDQVMILTLGNYMPLHWTASLVPMGLAGAGLAVSVLTLIALSLRGRLGMDLATGLFTACVALMLGAAATLASNGVLDSAPSSSLETRVADYYRISNRGGCRLVVSPVASPSETLKFQWPCWMRDRAPIGSLARLTIQPGRWGVEWIRDVAFAGASDPAQVTHE